MASSVQMDDVIPSTITLDLGTKQVSQDMDKAMVWDDSIESYRLMDKNLARVKVMLARPSPARYWGIRALAAVGVLALCAMVAITSLWVSERFSDDPTPAVQKSTVVGTPEPAKVAIAEPPASIENATKPAAKAASAPEQVTEGIKAEPAVSKQPPPAKPEAAAKSPAKPAPAAAAPASPPPVTPTKTVAAATKPAPATAAAPSSKVADKGPVATPKAPAVEAPKAVITSASNTKQFPPTAVKVEKNGVIFFDGKQATLIRIGEPLPNGERLIDVDEAYSTYATDRGIRQIRTSVQN